MRFPSALPKMATKENIPGPGHCCGQQDPGLPPHVPATQASPARPQHFGRGAWRAGTCWPVPSSPIFKMMKQAPKSKTTLLVSGVMFADHLRKIGLGQLLESDLYWREEKSLWVPFLHATEKQKKSKRPAHEKVRKDTCRRLLYS